METLLPRQAAGPEPAGQLDYLLCGIDAECLTADDLENGRSASQLKITRLSVGF